jgi:hypothetical protein
MGAVKYNWCVQAYSHTFGQSSSESEFLDEFQRKVFSFDLRFLFLQTHATSYSFCSALSYTVKEKGGKPDRKPHPLPNDLRNPYVNHKSEHSQGYAQMPQRNCTFMNSASRFRTLLFVFPPSSYSVRLLDSLAHSAAWNFVHKCTWDFQLLAVRPRVVIVLNEAISSSLCLFVNIK